MNEQGLNGGELFESNNVGGYDLNQSPSDASLSIYSHSSASLPSHSPLSHTPSPYDSNDLAIHYANAGHNNSEQKPFESLFAPTDSDISTTNTYNLIDEFILDEDWSVNIENELNKTAVNIPTHEVCQSELDAGLFIQSDSDSGMGFSSSNSPNAYISFDTSSVTTAVETNFAENKSKKNLFKTSSSFSSSSSSSSSSIVELNDNGNLSDDYVKVNTRTNSSSSSNSSSNVSASAQLSSSSHNLYSDNHIFEKNDTPCNNGDGSEQLMMIDTCFDENQLRALIDNTDAMAIMSSSNTTTTTSSNVNTDSGVESVSMSSCFENLYSPSSDSNTEFGETEQLLNNIENMLKYMQNEANAQEMSSHANFTNSINKPEAIGNKIITKKSSHMYTKPIKQEPSESPSNEQRSSLNYKKISPKPSSSSQVQPTKYPSSSIQGCGNAIINNNASTAYTPAVVAVPTASVNNAIIAIANAASSSNLVSTNPSTTSNETPLTVLATLPSTTASDMTLKSMPIIIATTTPQTAAFAASQFNTNENAKKLKASSSSPPKQQQQKAILKPSVQTNKQPASDLSYSQQTPSQALAASSTTLILTTSPILTATSHVTQQTHSTVASLTNSKSAINQASTSTPTSIDVFFCCYY
jgi:trimeric autotransporter adhesin